MNHNSIIEKIEELRALINECDHGASIDKELYNTVQLFAKDNIVLELLHELSGKNKIIESPLKDEELNIVTSDGAEVVLNGIGKLSFPRWLCHMFGVRHRCSHAVVSLLNGLIIVQKRHKMKDVSPGAFDVAVGGHVKGGSSYDETLFVEMEEELGFRKTDLSKIREIGTYESKVPMPGYQFLSVEARRVFAVELLPGAFDRIRFVDNEVAGVYLCDEKEISELLLSSNIGSGLKYTMPFYFKWNQ